MQAAGKLDGIQLNSEIKDLMFSMADTNTGSSTCISRMGLSGSSPAFNPAADFDLPLSSFQNSNVAVTIDRQYLTDAIQ